MELAVYLPTMNTYSETDSPPNAYSCLVPPQNTLFRLNNSFLPTSWLAHPITQNSHLMLDGASWMHPAGPALDHVIESPKNLYDSSPALSITTQSLLPDPRNKTRTIKMPSPPLPQGSSNSAEHAKLVVHLRHQWLINLLDQSSLTSLAATPAPSHQLQETPDSQVQAAICLRACQPFMPFPRASICLRLRQ